MPDTRLQAANLRLEYRSKHNNFSVTENRSQLYSTTLTNRSACTSIPNVDGQEIVAGELEKGSMYTL